MTEPSGILVVDKIAGVTSFDAVAVARRRLGVRRIGHAGTLDPPATGVLPLLIGEATKLTPYLVEQNKEYLARVRFGVETDTHDLTGTVLAEHPVGELTRDAIEAACRPFLGRVAQVPPMYSAVHHGGRRLYELAREGIEVERMPRTVDIHSIAVDAVEGGTATIRVVCGKGTYVRVLVSDVGKALGMGAAVERLTRTRVGPFTQQAAVAWTDFVERPGAWLWSRVLHVDAALADWPAVRLDTAGVRRFRHGQAADLAPAAASGGRVRVYDEAGTLLGVGQIELAGHAVRPVRIVHADRPGLPVHSA